MRSYKVYNNLPIEDISTVELFICYVVMRPQRFEKLLDVNAQLKGYDVSVEEDTNILSYTDFGSISEYAIPAVQWACGEGIITGITTSTLEPQGTTTRAQVATMLLRFVEGANE